MGALKRENASCGHNRPHCKNKRTEKPKAMKAIFLYLLWQLIQVGPLALVLEDWYQILSSACSWVRNWHQVPGEVCPPVRKLAPGAKFSLLSRVSLGTAALCQWLTISSTGRSCPIAPATMPCHSLISQLSIPICESLFQNHPSKRGWNKT